MQSSISAFRRFGVSAFLGVLLLAAVVRAEDHPRSVDEILTKVEQVGASVGDLFCSVEYTVDDRIGLAKSTRYGTILFKRKDPNPIFLITFDRLVEEDVVHRRLEWWLFDGDWLWEAREVLRQKIKRQVVRTGDPPLDLFSIDRAPFPVPFGQKKDEILRHFEVTLVLPAVGDRANADHLACVPREDSYLRQDYDQLDFFVDRELHLPVKIVAVARGGDQVTTADFPDLSRASINNKVPDDRFRLPPETDAYAEVVEPLPDPSSP